jgi:hypothetical protein
MFGDSNSQSAPSVMTLRAQSAIYGVVLPVLRGTARVAGKLIDWTNFQAITLEESAGGGSSFGGSQISYDYKAAVDIALAMSPGCAGIGLIWDGQGKYGNGNVEETFTIPSGTGSYTPQQVLEWAYDVGVSVITTEQVWVPAYDPSTGLPQSGGAPGVGDGYYTTVNVYTPMQRSDDAPHPGQYQITGQGSQRVYVFNYADAGKDAEVTYGLTVNLATEFEFFSGVRPQLPWAYMLSANPTRACSYAGTCHVAAEAFDLGSSGQLNNLNFELMGPGRFGGKIKDAAIDQCIHMVLDDLDGGCGFPTALIGDLTAAIAYCVSAGIFFSPLMDKQQTAASYLQDFCDAANLAASWSDGVYKFLPYGDVPQAGYGQIYIPDLTPVYDLDDDDFQAEGDNPPLKVEREDPETLSNIFEVDILDRDLDYNTNPIKDRDSSLVFRFGPISESPRKYDFICDRNVGAVVVNHLRLRATQIDTLTITFKLGWQYELLEKMDIVTVTCVEMGWVKKPFRLKEYDEDPETGATEWTAEPVVWGSASATLYPKQPPGGAATQRDAAPGSILPPIIFEAPDPLVPEGEYELWLGLCGALNLINNPGFESAPAPGSGDVADGWYVQGAPSWIYCAQETDSEEYSGSSNLYISPCHNAGVTVPANSFNYAAIFSRQTLPVSPGQRFLATCMANVQANTPLGGIFAQTFLDCRVLFSDGTVQDFTSNALTAANLGAGYQRLSVTVTVPNPPAGQTITGMQVFIWAEFNNQTSAEITVNGYPFDSRIDDVFVVNLSSEDANWGGCHVYGSSDGNTYKQVGEQSGPSRMGVLTADLPALAPLVNSLDQANTLAVDLSESGGTMLSGTAADRDSYRTLCWVEALNGQYELISYMTATLVGGNQYQLTSLQRGVYGTPILDHPAGMRFLRCDDAVTKLSFQASDVAQKAYIKATSFNHFGLAEEDLAEVTAYSYTLQGLFNNIGQIIANDATVDYDPASLGSSVTIRAYGSGSPGSPITFKKADGSSFTCAALSVPGSALTTKFYAMLNRAANTPYWLANYSQVLSAIGYGHVQIGTVTTPSASGSGGTTSGTGTTGASAAILYVQASADVNGNVNYLLVTLTAPPSGWSLNEEVQVVANDAGITFPLMTIAALPGGPDSELTANQILLNYYPGVECSGNGGALWAATTGS